MNKMFGLVVVVAVALVTGVSVAGNMLASHDHAHENIQDHGGGLDQCGGHFNRKTGEYHYHRPPKC